jgi:hypothetical protein
LASAWRADRVEMTLTIEWTPEEEARLRVVAQNSGLDITECARRLLTE